MGLFIYLKVSENVKKIQMKIILHYFKKVVND